MRCSTSVIDFDCERVDPADLAMAKKSRRPPSITARTFLGLRRVHRDGNHRLFYPHLCARRCDGYTRTGGALTLHFHRDFLGRTTIRTIRHL